MTLKFKSVVFSIFTTIFFLLVVRYIVGQLISREFQNLENQKMETGNKRVEIFLEDRFKQLNAKIADYAVWDDTYNFMEKKNQSYLDSNLTQSSFASLGVDEAIFVSKSGAFVASYALKKTTESESDFPGDLYEHFATGSALLTIDKQVGFKKGFLKTEDGLLFFVAREIVKSNGEGPSNGTVVFARYFDDAVLQSLKELSQSEVRMTFWEEKMTTDFAEAKKRFLSAEITESISILNDKEIGGYFVIKDVYGKPQSIARSVLIRDITAQGKRSLSVLTNLLTGAMIAISIVNYWFLSGLALKRVSLLYKGMNFGDKGLILKSHLFKKEGGDEIDMLSQRIDEIMRKMQITQMAVDSSTTHTIITDVDGVVIYANKAVSDLTGYSNQEIVGSKPSLWGRQMSDGFYQRMWQTIKVDRKPFTGEITNKRKNGDLYVAMATIFPIMDASGNLLGFAGSENDITEVKNTQEEMRRMNELMVGRELKMVELKKVISDLKTDAK